MTRAEDIWAARDDAIKRMVAKSWPELAAALEGRAGPGGATAKPVPKCHACGTRPARGTANGKPLCSVCVGRLGPGDTHVLEFKREGDW